MNIFSFTFYVVPELLLGVLLIGAKLEEMIDLPWKIMLIPFYIAFAALLAILIIDYRRRRHSGDRGIAKIAVQFFAWLLIVISFGLLVSKLDSVENSFSWSLTLGPLILLVGLYAIFEFTSCFSEGFKTYNIFLTRINKQHVFLWFVAEIGVFVFLFFLGMKLDLLATENEDKFIFEWIWVFIPLWVAFAATFFISFLICGNKKSVEPQNSEPMRMITIFAFGFWWVILLIFFVLLEMEIIWPGTIPTFALLLPFISGFLLMLFGSFCLYKKRNQDQKRKNVLDLNPLDENISGIKRDIDDATKFSIEDNIIVEEK
jgi:hypothetical protein